MDESLFPVVYQPVFEAVSDYDIIGSLLSEPIADDLETVAALADLYARKVTLDDFLASKDADYLRSLEGSLKCFRAFLSDFKDQHPHIDIKDRDFYHDLAAWQQITYGLVTVFRSWMLKQGYAIGTIRIRLAAIHSYAELAFNAGHMSEKQYMLIKNVHAYHGKDARNIDAKREKKRVGTKTATDDMPILTDQQVRALKWQPRAKDALLMCLFLDHGLRCGEVAALKVADMAVQRHAITINGIENCTYTGFLTFYREKVDKTQTHKLTERTAEAAWCYLHSDAEQHPQGKYLFPGTVKIPDNQEQAVRTRSLYKRVSVLGKKLEVAISPHILRHNWATRVARSKPNMKQFQIAGGWNSPAMPAWYIQGTSIANEGIRAIDLCEVDIVE